VSSYATLMECCEPWQVHILLWLCLGLQVYVPRMYENLTTGRVGAQQDLCHLLQLFTVSGYGMWGCCGHRSMQVALLFSLSQQPIVNFWN
jgi:hypothetical protein